VLYDIFVFFFSFFIVLVVGLVFELLEWFVKHGLHTVESGVVLFGDGVFNVELSQHFFVLWDFLVQLGALFVEVSNGLAGAEAFTLVGD